jgi:hypothetical protein
VIRPALVHPARVVAYGSSLGAYAALYFCRNLDCEVIAPSPRVSVHPVYGAPGWQRQVPFQHRAFDPAEAARCRAVVIYDPREPKDRRYIESEVLPQFPDAQVMRLPFAGHPTTQYLGDIGFLPAYMRAVIAGQPRPLPQRRQRLQSGTWFQVMAERCAQRGRLDWADTLIGRSLVLRPENMLALRTLGQVRTLQRRWAEAVAALESALAFDPADPLTLAMLKRARTGLEKAQLPTARAVDAPAAPPPRGPLDLPLRALRWLWHRTWLRRLDPRR